MALAMFVVDQGKGTWARAIQYAIGDPIDKNGLEASAEYLQCVDLKPPSRMCVVLDCSQHATDAGQRQDVRVRHAWAYAHFHIATGTLPVLPALGVCSLSTCLSLCDAKALRLGWYRRSLGVAVPFAPGTQGFALAAGRYGGRPGIGGSLGLAAVLSALVKTHRTAGQLSGNHSIINGFSTFWPLLDSVLERSFRVGKKKNKCLFLGLTSAA